MKKILVIRLGAMGDIALATAAVEALAKGYPGARIEFLLKARFSGLLEGDPRISGLWRFDEMARHRGTRGMLFFLREIQGHRFDLVVDLQGNLRSHFICCCLRSQKILRWDKRAWQRRLMVAVKGDASGSVPVFSRYLNALAPLSIATEGIKPRLHHGEWDAPFGKEKPYLAMAPGAHWPAKRWPIEHYASLAGKIADETGLKIAVVGGVEDHGAGEVIRRESPEQIFNLCGQLELGSLASCLAGAKVLVTNDTGPMHIAEAVGVPVLAFFGPTVRGFGFAPWRSESRVLEREMRCRPCSLHGRKPCPKKHHGCLSAITPGEAWQALEGMLDG